MRFGAHVSVASGYISALDYAESVGCECIQIFAKSPRQWRGPAIDPVSAQRFLEERQRRAFGPVFTHTAYLINIATSEPVLRERSIEALGDELVRASLLGANGVVTHVGNDPDADPAAAAQRVGEACARAIDLAGGDACTTRLLLENTAGAGRTYGSSIEELAASIAASGLSDDRLGVCLDTCHAFAYGYAVDTQLGWEDLADLIDAAFGLDRLGLIHANDCLFERGSRRDRHAWIGDGHIGREGFRAMVCSPTLSAVAVCTEMSGEVPIKDRENLERLKLLRGECAPSQRQK